MYRTTVLQTCKVICMEERKIHKTKSLFLNRSLWWSDIVSTGGATLLSWTGALTRQCDVQVNIHSVFLFFFFSHFREREREKDQCLAGWLQRFRHNLRAVLPLCDLKGLLLHICLYCIKCVCKTFLFFFFGQNLNVKQNHNVNVMLHVQIL